MEASKCTVISQSALRSRMPFDKMGLAKITFLAGLWRSDTQLEKSAGRHYASQHNGLGRGLIPRFWGHQGPI